MEAVQRIGLLFIAGAVSPGICAALINTSGYELYMWGLILVIGLLSAFLTGLLPVENLYASMALSLLIGFVMLVLVWLFAGFSVQ